jgi:hypothetical protein
VSVDIAIIPAHRYVHLKVNAASVVAPHLRLYLRNICARVLVCRSRLRVCALRLTLCAY